jgi:hypothetical protein
MEGTLIGKPADTLFKMLVYMQQWRMLVKLKDRSLVDAAMGASDVFILSSLCK